MQQTSFLVEKLLGMTLIGTEWVLWLLVLLSIVSVGIVIERLFYFSRMRLDFPKFAETISQSLVRDDIQGMKGACDSSHAIEAQVVLRALSHRDKGPQAMDEAMTGFLVGNRQYLDRGLVVLGTLGNNAPFIGLFGTVIGIIKAFHDLSMNPAGGPSVVMGGISEALVATAVGLMVAIPAVVAFNAFQRLIKRRVANAESIQRMILSHFGS